MQLKMPFYFVVQMYFKAAQFFGMSSYSHKNAFLQKYNISAFKRRVNHSFMIPRYENILL